MGVEDPTVCDAGVVEVRHEFFYIPTAIRARPKALSDDTMGGLISGASKHLH